MHLYSMQWIKYSTNWCAGGNLILKCVLKCVEWLFYPMDDLTAWYLYIIYFQSIKCYNLICFSHNVAFEPHSNPNENGKLFCYLLLIQSDIFVDSCCQQLSYKVATSTHSHEWKIYRKMRASTMWIPHQVFDSNKWQSLYMKWIEWIEYWILIWIRTYISLHIFFAPLFLFYFFF